MRRRPVRLLAVALLLAGLALGGPHLWAWHQLRAARADLGRHQPEEARAHLDRCLRVWPRSAEAHLLASRAARQGGDLEAADRHLRECQRLRGGASDEITLEWALLRAGAGHPEEVEE